MHSGILTWSSGWSDRKSSISIFVSTMNNDDKYLRLNYTQTDRDNGEKKDFNYKIPLTTTDCRYGGIRYWFICPMSRDGKYCGRRVGTLYKDGDYFACRHCYSLSYDSRNVSGMMKAYGSIISLPELEKLEKEIKRTHYRGKPTRRYLSYLKKSNRSMEQMVGAVGLLNKRYKKIKK